MKVFPKINFYFPQHWQLNNIFQSNLPSSLLGIIFLVRVICLRLYWKLISIQSWESKKRHWLTHVLASVPPWIFIIAKSLLLPVHRSPSSSLSLSWWAVQKSEKLYEKCFITARCTFAVTNEWEGGWQTDSQSDRRQDWELCVSVYRYSYPYPHRHTHALLNTHASAIVLAMHKQAAKAARRIRRGGLGWQDTKWVMKCWQDILLYKRSHIQA